LQKNFKIAVLTGGPSFERGIALNSARSVLDHLGGDGIEILPIYFDQKKNPYRISPNQLYSNTPSDFDFKLQKAAKRLTPSQLVKFLKSCDLTFPIMHGAFGEDGEVQRFLEKNKIPFVGTDSAACKRAFDKYEANEFIAKNGFNTLPSALLKIYEKNHLKICQEFFRKHSITRAIVKPASGGSSIGVFSVTTPEEAVKQAALLFRKRMDTRVVIEPFCEGKEFTVIILQNRFGLPVAILPTEIEMSYKENQIFDYRRKYLPTRQVTYHCPPRFEDAVIEQIQVQAEQLFTLLGMRDFARFDGWLLPNGKLWFSDFNPISGMEQNSFLFQQSARVGLTHRGVLRYIVKHACQRQDIVLPPSFAENTKIAKKPVYVLFGGATSERQVSLMSGTNVWLKLRRSNHYSPKPFLLAPDGGVWEVPYALLLNHTVEDIFKAVQSAAVSEARLHSFEKQARLRLALEENFICEEFFLPRRLTLPEWIKEAPFAFLALHGGDGEDGTLQKMCDVAKVPYNGPSAKVSKLCMNKFQTGEAINSLKIEGVSSLPKRSFLTRDLVKMDKNEIRILWETLLVEFQTSTIIVKPQNEGCSSGIVRLYSSDDFLRYVELVAAEITRIPRNTFTNQNSEIEMPLKMVEFTMLEPFIETDSLRAVGKNLRYIKKTGWIEITVGVLENKTSKLHSLNPSLTVAEGEVLSVEEKFQGGTGINITPPPPEIVKPHILKKVQKAVEAVAKGVGITSYSRIDLFMNIESGEVIVIEINTLPALTPSTVIFHQALAEKPPLTPLAFLESIIATQNY